MTLPMTTLEGIRSQSKDSNNPNKEKRVWLMIPSRKLHFQLRSKEGLIPRVDDSMYIFTNHLYPTGILKEGIIFASTNLEVPIVM